MVLVLVLEKFRSSTSTAGAEYEYEYEKDTVPFGARVGIPFGQHQNKGLSLK